MVNLFDQKCIPVDSLIKNALFEIEARFGHPDVDEERSCFVIGFGEDFVGEGGESKEEQDTDAKGWVDKADGIDARSSNGGEFVRLGDFAVCDNGRHQNRHGNRQNDHIGQIGENEFCDHGEGQPFSHEVIDVKHQELHKQQ